MEPTFADLLRGPNARLLQTDERGNEICVGVFSHGEIAERFGMTESRQMDMGEMLAERGIYYIDAEFFAMPALRKEATSAEALSWLPSAEKVSRSA